MVDTNKKKFSELAKAFENAKTVEARVDVIRQLILFSGAMAAAFDELIELILNHEIDSETTNSNEKSRCGRK